LSLGDRLRRGLEHPRLPLITAVIAVLLCAPSLWLGLQVDDYVLRLMLMEDPPDRAWVRSSFTLFTFLNGDEEINRDLIEGGGVPWWMHPRLKLAFFRPLTGMTHWIDFRIWPNQPWLMHVQSLLWFAGAIAAAALFYRRLLVPTWIAGLAGLLFAIDDAHGLPAVWLANRNASIGVLFGLVALIAHDRWRRDGWRPGSIIGPLALLLGLLAGEIALAAGGYLLAYALFIDTDTWPRRMVTLVPAGGVGVAWWVAYRVQGYGAYGSGIYIDPGTDPLIFAEAVVQRAPLLLCGLWALPSNLSMMMSEAAGQIVWWVVVGLMLVIAGLLLPLLRRDRVARFFALGMLLSILPACATFPDDRLLFFAGFGGMGLIAQFMGGVWKGAEWMPRTRIRGLPFKATCWTLVAFHLLLAPLGLLTASAKVRMVGSFIERAANSLPSDPAVTDQVVVVVNTPSAFISVYGPPIQALQGRRIPRRTLNLGSGIYPITVTRSEPNMLTVRPEGGFLAPPGSPQPGREASQPAFDPRYFQQSVEYLYRDATPMQVGDRIAYGGTIVEVLDITDDGRPLEVSFRFDVSLEHPTLVWLQWNDGVYAPFDPPQIGGSTVLPAVTIPW
jgi:hypothetical protein